jgi:hypothetical protein
MLQADTPASRLRGGMPGLCHKYAHILKKVENKTRIFVRECVLSAEVVSYVA